jgi:hypothetical protein
VAAELADETIYFARAFAVTSSGVAYGDQIAFTTLARSRIVNLSIRSIAGSDGQSLLAGFTLSGIGSKPILVRGVGPTLGVFGVSGVLADPTLQLTSGTRSIAANDNWDGSAAIANATTRLGAFALPAGSKDAVLMQTLEPGGYSAQVAGGTGAALVELYDAGEGAQLVLSNVSARSRVSPGAGLLIAGFTIAGTEPQAVLIRAIGPTLSLFQVSDVLADPMLELYSGGNLIASNDDWGGRGTLAAVFPTTGAFPLAANSKDAVLLVTLSPGSYTAQVSGVGGTAGVALVEIYVAGR